jgi:hypothetical protein
LGALLCAGLVDCEGGYPIAPTACDDWCLATERASCEEDYPEGCVSACEDRAIGRRYPDCEAPWLTLGECYRQAPDTDFQCVEDESRPRPICASERVATATCVSPVVGSCVEACLRQAIECRQPQLRCEQRCLRFNFGCERLELELYECQLAGPADCQDPDTDTRPVEDIPCIAQIGAFLDCTGFDGTAPP